MSVNASAVIDNSTATTLNMGTHTIRPPTDETQFEYYSDIVLGLAFLVTAVFAAKRMAWSHNQRGAETTVVTAFYSLILLTSTLRAIWFLVPSFMVQPTYTPSAVMAFDDDYSKWVYSFAAEILVGLGSLCLFSIFILILVYWADILKKYFFPGRRRSRPMGTFLLLILLLVVLEVLNATLYLFSFYSIDGMILANSCLLSVVSIVCVCNISMFSHRFRTVLKTLGAINQVSTESQVKRIVWITYTGNAFFFVRAFLEAILAALYLRYWHATGHVDMVFSHPLWDTYILLKHWSEVAILTLMLYILQSRFATNTGVNAGAGAAPPSNRDGYEQVPDNIKV